MPVWKLHSKRVFRSMPEAAPPPFRHSTPSCSSDALVYPSSSLRSTQHKPAPAPARTLYSRRRNRPRAKKQQQQQQPALPISPVEESESGPFKTKRQGPYRARFIDLDEVFSQFSCAQLREADGALEWFRFQMQLASHNLVRDLLVWVRRDFAAAEHAAKMWREDIQAWLDGFGEDEMGGAMYREAVRVAGDLPIMVCGEGNVGELWPNDIDPTLVARGCGDEMSDDEELSDIVDSPESVDLACG